MGRLTLNLNDFLKIIRLYLHFVIYQMNMYYKQDNPQVSIICIRFKVIYIEVILKYLIFSYPKIFIKNLLQTINFLSLFKTYKYLNYFFHIVLSFAYSIFSTFYFIIFHYLKTFSSVLMILNVYIKHQPVLYHINITSNLK